MERNQLQSDSPKSLPSCTHIFTKGRHCRQAVANPGDLFCAIHAPSHVLAAPPDPLAELSIELGEITEIHQVSRFLSRVLKLACQNLISISRAAALTYIANSLLNSLRLQSSELRIAAKEDPEKLVIDWTDVPRPEYDRVKLDKQQPLPDTLHTPVPA